VEPRFFGLDPGPPDHWIADRTTPVVESTTVAPLMGFLRLLPPDRRHWARMGASSHLLVYLIEAPHDVVKVGCSQKPVERSRQLSAERNGTPVFALGEERPHRLVAVITRVSFAHEKVLHRGLQSEHVGGEYFRGPLVRRFVESVLSVTRPIGELVPSWGSKEAC
jgi:hypothetical protein